MIIKIKYERSIQIIFSHSFFLQTKIKFSLFIGSNKFHKNIIMKFLNNRSLMQY